MSFLTTFTCAAAITGACLYFADVQKIVDQASASRMAIINLADAWDVDQASRMMERLSRQSNVRYADTGEYSSKFMEPGDASIENWVSE